MSAARRSAVRVRNALLRSGRALVRFRGTLVLTVVATGDGPNLALCLTGPGRLCRRVRGIALQPLSTARRVRVPGTARVGDGVVGLSVDLPPDSFLRREQRILDVVGWRGTIPVRPADAGVLERAGTIAPALAGRWDIELRQDEHGRLVLQAQQPDHTVTAHDLVLDGDRLVVGWERAAMTRELRLRHLDSGTELTVPGDPVGIRSVATVAVADLCATGAGRWSVAIGEPGGPWVALVQDRALQAAAGVTAPVLAAGAAGTPVWVRPAYGAGGALSIRVEPLTREAPVSGDG
jgi:hypothetical protein